MAGKEWTKDRAVVWISVAFAWGIVTLVRTVYADGKPEPLMNFNLELPKKGEVGEGDA